MAQARRSDPVSIPGGKLFGAAELGLRLREARERAGLSIEAVAASLSLSVSAIRQWESGQKFPSRENLAEFAALSNADLTWLHVGFSANDIDLVRRMAGRPNPVPLLDAFDAIAPHVDRKTLHSDAWVFPSWPSSDQAFAVKLFDHRNLPAYEVDDIVIIGPAVPPKPDDMVLARVSFSSEGTMQPLFAKYALKEFEPLVLRLGVLEHAKTQIHRGIETIYEALDDPAEAKRAVEEILEEVINAPKEPAINLVPLRGGEWQTLTMGFGALSGRIVGVMTEHHHPRRAFSTDT